MCVYAFGVSFFFFPSICSEKPGLWHSQKGFPETQIRVPAGGEGEASLVGGVCTGEGGGEECFAARTESLRRAANAVRGFVGLCH